MNAADTPVDHENMNLRIIKLNGGGSLIKRVVEYQSEDDDDDEDVGGIDIRMFFSSTLFSTLMIF